MPSKDKGIRLGHAWQSDEVLRYRGPSNLITVAPARSGKSRDVLMPFLLDFPGSVVVIDPKGEFSAVCAKRRAQFGEVVYLDPYDLLGKLGIGARAASSHNPMSVLQRGSLESSALRKKIADALVLEEGRHADSYFVEGARGLCSMCMGGLIELAEPHEHNLISMRSVITGAFRNGLDVFGFAEWIMRDSADEQLRQQAARYTTPAAKESRSLNDIISTADVQTSFLSDAALAQSLRTSGLSFQSLKEKVVTVFVTLPMHLLEVSGRYFRLTVASALCELLACGKGVPTVILVDEAFQCGYLKSLENAMSMSAGLNTQVWLVFQDVNQISALYPAWQTLIANAGVRMFFTPRDPASSEFLSSLSGQTEHRAVSKSVGMPDAQAGLLKRLFAFHPERYAPSPANVNVSFCSVARPLVLPHECREIPGDEMFLFIEGVNGVVRAKRRPYYEEREFKGLYEKNPLYK